MAPYCWICESASYGRGIAGRMRKARGEVRGQSRLGPPVSAAPARNGFDYAATANEISRARVGRSGSPTRGADHGATGCHPRRVARRPADHGRPQHALADDRALGIHPQKKRYTPTNNAGLMSRPRAGSGTRGSRSAMGGTTCFSMSAASRPICCAATAAVPAAPAFGTTRPVSHWQTHTVVAALRVDGLTAPAVFDGPIDTATFLAYVEQVLVPTLRPGDVVVLDNLAVHKQPRCAPRSNASARTSDFCRPTVPTSTPSSSRSRS